MDMKQIGIGVVALVVVGGLAVGGYMATQKPDTPTEPDPTAEAVAKTKAKGGPGALKSLATGSDKPNVLIVLWDTTRADHLSVYGYEKDTTPFMAEWAEDGMVFERAVSPAMWTVPSHASMFTGLPPVTHGTGIEWRWLDNHHVTMADWFGENGYDTYAFSANPNLAPNRMNLVQGFDLTETSWSKEWVRQVRKNTRRKLIKRDKSTEISPSFEGTGAKSMDFNAGPVAAKAFIKWVQGREDSSKPWLAYINYMEAHKPRVPAIKSRRKISTEEEIGLGLDTDLTFKSQLLYTYGQMEMTPEEINATVGVYDATLVDLDNATNLLITEMKKRGMLENTIVVFTADHGEQLGEHHIYGHRNKVYQQLLHVPLVIWAPGMVEAGRVDTPVSNLDLFYTLTELAKLEAPESGLSKHNLLKIKEYVPAVFAQIISQDHSGYQRVKQWSENDFDIEPWTRTHQAIVSGAWKLIRDSVGEEQLFNVVEDPQEENEVAAANPEKAAELRQMLKDWADAQVKYDPAKRDDQDGETEDSDEMKAQLEMLGYIEEEDEGEEEEPPPPMGSL